MSLGQLFHSAIKVLHLGLEFRVHISGPCRRFHDANTLIQALKTLTEKYESQFSIPWIADYHPSMLQAIVGIEISINDIQCKYKLSQNRSAQDRAQVIEKLKARGSTELADAMERNSS